MFLAVIAITLRKSILDPQGSMIAKSLRNLDFRVEDTRAGKHLELTFRASDENHARELLQEMCAKLLVNSVTEEYRIISLNAYED
ncbi:MAG: phosphoribosylformylglycinamidine synthase subunit PurS [Symbiobacteriaceae bacterium]|nr:phosphoribosylformylglycinamidine synthase subunit PurS [Symbiobacteriaceae bacterium]